MRDPRILDSVSELEREAAAFVEELRPSENKATLVTLSGDLGAGKTSFTQAAARALGVTDAVTSPTFVLAKSYALPSSSAFKTLMHIDAYRLSEGKDLGTLRFTDSMREPGTLVMLEWPEMVEDGLPPADVRIRLEVRDTDSRSISYA